MIIAPYVPTGARQLTNGGENEVQNDKFMENFENLRNDPGSPQMTPGRFRELFLTTRASLKISQSEDLATSKKHPLGVI